MHQSIDGIITSKERRFDYESVFLSDDGASIPRSRFFSLKKKRNGMGNGTSCM